LKYYGKEQKFVQSHVHTDMKLFLGYVSCIIAGGSFYYEYTTGFRESINVTTISVIVFWILQSIAFAYSYFIEKNEIFMGTQYSHGRPSATLRISGKMEKYTSKYPLTLTYSDKLTNKSATTKIEPNVATWFTTKGTLVRDAIDSDLKSYVTTLQQQLHQE
jgi:signal peptidase complex subunit 2